MNYRPQRTIIVSINNLCNNIETIKNIVLHSLLISHGIRIDTTLYIIDHTRKIVYSLNGYELRHLYAEEKSLKGFITRFFCENKLFVGTNIYPLSIFSMKNNSYDLVLTTSVQNYSDEKIIVWSPLTSILFNILIIDNYSMKHLNLLRYSTILTVKAPDIVSFIIFSHYIIDKVFGGWIRRYGRIEYREPISQDN
ncbi:hypothetical protein [Staphylothermus hellenicus]|uniref:Uncharacterized protein n=1 Tax=Staphylothermus hellenicus (strain DSM 12710 / JCM 10830 / BK20S6-10-b1 / P8) TaxID=591019 RepID=D7DAH9_STAHD|nr:hypothetical protein [Staphylothermus hellenicus]ADI31176.1 hypothetical protein Shell_0024 [Staphylothermus hellenicus DSM 12710]